MSKERLKNLLNELGDELHHTGDVDEETRALLSELNDDIDRLTGDSFENAVDRAKSLESRFAANHPVAARIAREFTDLLAKMGI